jgi:endonuclease YncB( thermonuclease family)
MAWFYRFYARELKPEDATVYEQAEAQARKKKLGLWADARLRRHGISDAAVRP